MPATAPTVTATPVSLWAKPSGSRVGLGAADMKKAQDCVAGDSNACAELGKRAAQVGIPLGGVTQGVTNARNCNNGDRNACIALGEAVMATARYVHA